RRLLYLAAARKICLLLPDQFQRSVGDQGISGLGGHGQHTKFKKITIKSGRLSLLPHKGELKMQRFLSLSGSILLLFAVSASAQIKIKIPKVEIPKKEQPGGTKSEPSLDIPGRSSNTSARSSNRQIVIDDGFTFFDAEPLHEYSASLRRNVGTGWYLRSHLRMFGTAPNRSAFKMVVTKAGRDLAIIRCEGTPYRKGEDPVPENRSRPEDDYLLTNQRGCEDKTIAIEDTGKKDVKVYFINGNTDAEELLRTYKIDGHAEQSVRGLATEPVAAVPQYSIQRHAETSAAILFVRPRGMNQRLGPNYFREAGDGDFNSEIEIYFNFSPEKQVNRLRSMSTRCSVNGTFLNFPGPSPYAD